MVQPQASVYLPPVLAEPCPDLPELKDGRLSSILSNHIETARLYSNCKQRHADLVDVIEGQKGVAK